MINLAVLANEYEGINEQEKRSLVDYYNEHCIKLVKPNRRYKMKYSDNWCAMFTSVIAHRMGMNKDMFPYEVSVLQQTEIAKENECFTTDHSKVRAGDLITYNWGRDYVPDHVGIIESIRNGLITVVEGNYKGTVGTRKVVVTSENIFGYILL